MQANPVTHPPERAAAPALWILPLAGLALLAWTLLGYGLPVAASLQPVLQGASFTAALLCALLALGGGRAGRAYWPGLMALSGALLGLAPWLTGPVGSPLPDLLETLILAGYALLHSRRSRWPATPRAFAVGILLTLLVSALGLLVSSAGWQPFLQPQWLHLLALGLLGVALLNLAFRLRRHPGRSALGLLLSLLLQLVARWGFDVESAESLLLQTLAWAVLFAGLCPWPGRQEEQQRISQKVLVGLMADFQRAREEEAEAKQFAESIIENLPLMLFVKDATDLRFQRINKYGEYLLGQRREELLGKNDYDFFPPEQADFFTATDRAVLAGQDIVDIPEERVATPDGERWLHTRKIPLRNARGQPQFLLGISEDITAQRELELRFTSLFDAAPNGLMLINRHDRIVLANAGASRLFGYGLDELVNSPITRLLPQRDHAAHAELTHDFWSHPTAQQLSGRNRVCIHRDGHEIPVEIALQPLPWLGQQHVLASFTDVTERQRFISELEQASRYKSQFLANMSHELRTPMNSIIGFTEKVLKSAHYLTPRHRDALDTVQRNAHHLLGLISDMLDLAKIEAGRMDVELETLDLRALLQQMQAEFLPQAAARGLSLTLELPPEPLSLHTDRGKLVQICNNLLSNAVKYTEQGRINLRLTTLQDDELGAAVELQVQDTGLGIHPDDQQKLFKEFARAREAREKRIQGTGLGLLITAQLVDLLGGRISLHSVHGEGSLFSVILPR